MFKEHWYVINEYDKKEALNAIELYLKVILQRNQKCINPLWWKMFFMGHAILELYKQNAMNSIHEASLK